MTALAGCGAGGKQQTTTRTGPRDPNADLKIPSRVPRRAAGDADAQSVKVIARWLRTLQRGDETGAARYWATGAKFQNATPVLTIDTPIEKLAIQKSLPCGAKIKRAGGPAALVVVVFVLPPRRGGAPGSRARPPPRGGVRPGPRPVGG